MDSASSNAFLCDQVTFEVNEPCNKVSRDHEHRKYIVTEFREYDTDIKEEEIDELEDVKMDIKEYNSSYNWLQNGNNVDLRSMTSIGSVSVKESCDSKDRQQEAARLDVFVNKTKCVTEYREYNRAEVIKCDSDIKEEETDNHGDIGVDTEKHRFNYKLLQIEKIEDIKSEFGMDSISVEEGCENIGNQQATAKLNDFVNEMKYSNEQTEHLEVCTDVIYESDSIEVESNILEYVKIDICDSDIKEEETDNHGDIGVDTEKHRFNYKLLQIEKIEDIKDEFGMDSISVEEDCENIGSQQTTAQLNDFVNEMKYSDEQTEHLEVCTDVIYESDSVEVESNIPEYVKIDIEEHKLSYAFLKTEETENMLTRDNSLSKASWDGEDNRQVNVRMDETRNNVDCDNESRKYDTVEKIVVICDNDSEGEIVSDGDIVMEIEIYTHNVTANSKDTIKSCSGRKVRGTEKQNIDPNAIKMDIEYELGDESLEIDKTDDVKEEANVDDTSDLVGSNSHSGEQVTVKLNGSWDELACDNAQGDYNMIEFMKCDRDVKKENTDLEDVLIDNEKFTQERQENEHIEGPQWYYCHHCKFKTAYKQYLKRHFTFEHNDSTEWFKCPHCELKTKRKRYLEAHLELKHNIVSEKGKLHQCQFCDYRCKFTRVLRQHLKTKHRENLEWQWHYCQNCEFKAKERALLLMHCRRKHDQDCKWYKCYFCDHKTKHKPNLIRHFKTQHDQDSEWHHCQHCLFKTKHKVSLQEHLESKHSIVSEEGILHYCQYCDYRSKFKKFLKSHLKTKHDQNRKLKIHSKDESCLISYFKVTHYADAKWYECCFCDYKSKNKGLVTRHFKTVHDQNGEWHHCQHCPFKTKHKGSLWEHVESKHSIVSEEGIVHYCQYCNYRSKFKKFLKSHLKFEHDQNMEWHHYQTREFKSKDKSSLISHFKVSHDVKTEEVIEEVNVDDTSNLPGFNSQHVSNIQWYHCKFCGYKTKDSFKKHLEDNHKDRLQWYYYHHGNSSVWYKCTLCNLKVRKRSTLRQHYKIQHDRVNERHRCQHCGFKTRYKGSLEAHLEFKHNIVSENGKLHQCQFCDYTCKFADILKQHLKTKHGKYITNNMEWHCQNCEFKTKAKTSLRNHFKNKHDANAKWYKCSICDYKMKNKYNLIRHYKTQHDQDSEWHYCLHCTFMTKHKTSLDEHLEFKHDIVDEKGKFHQCQFCDYKCKYKSVLKQHIKTKHTR